MKNEPMQHLHFDLLRSPLEAPPFSYEVAKIAAQVADLTDRAITEAMIAAAQHEGLTDLYLIDRQFLFEAIKEKVEREKNEPLTLDELRQMDGEPAYFVSLLDGFSAWGIVHIVSMSQSWFIAISGTERAFGDRDSYGTAWIGYPHKPKEDGR